LAGEKIVVGKVRLDMAAAGQIAADRVVPDKAAEIVEK
jgi:hypothetical protein